MKLLGISLASLFFAFLLWVILSVFSQQQSYEAYDHPLMKLPERTLILEPSTFESASEFVQQQGIGGLLLKLHVTQDGHFFTASDEALQKLFEALKKNPTQFKGPKTFLYTYELLKSLSEDIIPVQAWLQLNPRFWVFDIMSNALDVDKNLVQLIESQKIQDTVVIRSETDLIVSSLKEQRPIWIYGSTQSDLTQMLTMASARLEGLPRFQRDIYFSPLKIQGRDVLNERVFSEIRKRKKKIAIGPLHTDLDREQALKYQPDFLIISEKYLEEIVLQ